MDVDMSSYVAAYRRKRDRIMQGLGDLYEINRPGGAFYVFPKARGDRHGVRRQGHRK